MSYIYIIQIHKEIEKESHLSFQFQNPSLGVVEIGADIGLVYSHGHDVGGQTMRCSGSRRSCSFTETALVLVPLALKLNELLAQFLAAKVGFGVAQFTRHQLFLEFGDLGRRFLVQFTLGLMQQQKRRREGGLDKAVYR